MMKRNLVLIWTTSFLILVTGCVQSASPQTTPTPTPEAPETSFFLDVIQPVDNSIVNTDKVEVRGDTRPRAVVSVNEEITSVGSDGIFSVTITIEEGPNIIEVIASDEKGNEAMTILTVTLTNGG